MKRHICAFLDRWLTEVDRKPLVLRGPRQVGKTWLVRDLAARQQRQLIELNMERRPELAQHFRGNNPRQGLNDLGADLGITIDLSSSIVFFDEIQAQPQLLATLRWFREELPELVVIAAGSLLEFALRDHAFSMPVGRITYAHIEPVSFYEFLSASENDGLKELLERTAQTAKLSPRLHARALELFAEYCLIGGMPEVVADWLVHRDDDRRLQRQLDLIATYRDDFNKYRGRLSPELLRHVMDSIPKQLGGRFIYSQIAGDASPRQLKQATELLYLARVCHRVEHTAANGLPLGAESNATFFKSLLVDIGLVSAQLGLSRLAANDIERVIWADKGALAEQFVGQHLRCLPRPYEEPRLYYWQRTGGRQGEIDYILQHGPRILPLEVKAGRSGSMKSLHAFMAAKGLPLAIRLDTNCPSIQDLEVKTTTGQEANYRLINLPMYMTESIPAAVAAAAETLDH